MASSSRWFQLGWTFQNIKGNKILDVGSTGSLLPIQLAGMGYDVYSVNHRNYKDYHGLVHPNMEFIKGDIRFAMFPDESFNTVVAVSTLEHVGTKDYGNRLIENEGDLKAVKEISRILETDGRFIFTVPYNGTTPQPPQKTYNEETLRRLLKGLFRVVDEAYFYKKNRFWYKATSVELKDVKGEKQTCIVAIKV